MTKPPKAPPVTAPLKEHKRHAREILEHPAFKQKPEGFQDKTDEAKP